jgi:subtilisin family serine protease
MNPLDLVKLTALMELTSGRPEIAIGLLDGPVALDHPDLASENIHEIPGALPGKCTLASSTACRHGTFVAGILSAKRDSPAPAICPNCTLLVRPIFAQTTSRGETLPSATPQELAAAIIECINAGALVVNLSAAFAQPSIKGERELEEALDYALKRGVLVVAAAGNQSTLGSSAITRHTWVVPVVACDSQGRPLNLSNLGSSVGRRGLSAPGDDVTSLTTGDEPLASGGTSVAAPFVTSAIALLWSEFPDASAADVKLAITEASVPRRRSVFPPLLDAWAAYQAMMTVHTRR